MSNIELLTATTREILQELANIVKTTRRRLAKMVQSQDWPHRQPLDPQPGQFTHTLEHLGEVREGFALSLRTSPQISLAQIKHLVEDILLDWEWMQHLNLSWAPQQQIERVGQQVVVYNHALVAFSIVPQLPAQAITFPQRHPSYRDVFPPSLPNETLARIEEIERTIYQAEIGPLHEVAYAPFRRTYAFFEASNWLVDNYLNPLLAEY